MRPSPRAATISSEQVDTDDELLAVVHPLPLLISARCKSTVKTVAERVHAAAFGRRAPFVTFPASEFLARREEFAEQWSLLLLAGHGGSVLITSVEEMPIPAQALLAVALDELRVTRPFLVVRLMTGTTVSLLDRVNVGEFSENLLYRLNAIHLHRHEVCDPCPECAARR